MGDIYRGNGSRWGSISSDGKLYDTEGRYLGSINSSTGEIRDDQYRFIGRINYDGRINDAEGYHRGSVNERGEFYDEHGDYLGSIWGFTGKIGAYHPGRGSRTGGNGPDPYKPVKPPKPPTPPVPPPGGAGSSGGIIEAILGGFIIFAIYLAYKIIAFVFNVVTATLYLMAELCTSPFPISLIALSVLTLCINELTASKSRRFSGLWVVNGVLSLVWGSLFWSIFDKRSVSVPFYLFSGILFSWLMTWITLLFYKIFGDSRIQNREFRKRLLLILGAVLAVTIVATALCKYFGIGGVGLMNQDRFPFDFGTVETGRENGGGPSGTTEGGNTDGQNEAPELDIPEGAVFRDQNAYYIYDIKEEGLDNYREVEEFCEEQGGHLAAINSQDENDFLYSYVCDNGLSVSFFGYSDEDEEGSWEWAYGSSSYENWADGQPNNGSANKNQRDENYAEFSKKNRDGTWNDAPFGSNTYHFICEWEMTEKNENTHNDGDAGEDIDIEDTDDEMDETFIDDPDEYFTELSSGELEYTSPAGDVRYIFPEWNPEPGDEPSFSYTLTRDGDREEDAFVYYKDTELSISLRIYTLKNTSIKEYFEEKKSEHGREFEFSVVRENECAYSYYLFDGETIDYIRAVIENDTLYETEYEYPTQNRTVCDDIVEQYSKQKFISVD